MLFTCESCGMRLEVLPVPSIVNCHCGHRQFVSPSIPHGVTPIQPRDTSHDSRMAFGRASDDVDRREFYAGWRAYDEALERMPERQRILQQRAEVLELERQFAL